MTHLDRRIERIEQRLERAHGPQLIYIAPNLEEDRHAQRNVVSVSNEIT